jgi:hypothetical protein
MARWPAGCLGMDPAEPKLGQIEAVDEDVDDANWIVLADPVFHAFRKQRALPTIRTINEALHPSPRKSCGNHIARITSSAAFSHSQGQTRKSASAGRSALPQKEDIQCASRQSEFGLAMRISRASTFYALSSSSKASAFFKSGVSKPSVNQL